MNFYYPVAVGGPVTKTIDQMAADFGKENPDIKVNPIYSGTYQESIVKALTAHKSGKPPQLAVLLSTDMFSLIDEDAIVPIDDIAKSADDKKWLDGFYQSFMMNSRTGGKTWGIPFQRSTIVLYWNKEPSRRPASTRRRRPANWDRDGRVREEADQDATPRGNVTQWGVKIPSSGFPYWLFQGLTHAERRDPDERGRHRDLLRQARGDRGAAVLGRPRRASTRCMPPRHGRVGHDAEGLLREEGGDDLDHHRQPHQHPHQRRFPFGVAMLPANKQRGQPTGGGNFYIFPRRTPAEQAAALKFAKWVTAPRARRAVEHRHRLRRGHARGLGDRRR